MVDSTLSALTKEANIKNINDFDEIYAVINGVSKSLSLLKLSEYLNQRTGIYCVKDFGAVGDGVTDDYTAIQRAINSAKIDGGGIVSFPSGIYALSSPLRPESGVNLRGVRCAPGFTHACPDLGIIMNTGTWLKPLQLGKINGIEFNNLHDSVNIEPLSNIEINGIGFYGFNVAIKGGAFNTLSFGFGRLQDLFFLGADGLAQYTVHALEIENFQHLQINHLKAFNCLDPFLFKANHQHCSPGNSVFIDLYAYMGAVSGNYGLALHSMDGSLQLNAITVIRPQINWFHSGETGKSNISLEGFGSGQVTHCHLIDTNTEGVNGSHIKWANAYNCSANIAAVANGSIDATVILENSSGVIYSQSPEVTIKCDGPSSARTPVFGSINSVIGQNIPAGMRAEEGTSPREFFTGLGRDGKGLRVTEGSSAVRLENSQITQQIHNLSGSDIRTILRENQAGTIYVSLNTASTGIIYLPLITSSKYGLEYTIVRKDAVAADLLIEAQKNHSISGFMQILLHKQWDYVTVRATDDGGTWLLMGTNGIVMS